MAQKFQARSVVIADGGFQANTEMVREHISPAPDRLLQRHGGTAMGDGYRMAKALGAATTSEMGNFYGHLHSREAMTDARLWPRPQADDLAAAGIVIDATGKRVARRGLWRHLPVATPSPACPTRSARPLFSIRRSGTDRPAAAMCSRPIRWCRKPAARCIAPTRSQRSRAMIGLPAAAA